MLLKRYFNIITKIIVALLLFQHWLEQKNANEFWTHESK